MCVWLLLVLFFLVCYGYNKRRKLNTGKYFPAELPEATVKKVVGDNDATASEQRCRYGTGNLWGSAAPLLVR